DDDLHTLWLRRTRRGVHRRWSLWPGGLVPGGTQGGNVRYAEAVRAAAAGACLPVPPVLAPGAVHRPVGLVGRALTQPATVSAGRDRGSRWCTAGPRQRSRARWWRTRRRAAPAGVPGRARAR